MKLMVDKIFCDWKVSQSNMSKSQNGSFHSTSSPPMWWPLRLRRDKDLSTTWNAAIENKMVGVQKTIGFQPNEDKK